ncbi:MAG: aminotransferase class V-fold PLP-dependent enzyme [Planctomycetota bacterium]|jgi:cysteine desulfurase
MPIFPRNTYMDHNATTPVAPRVRKVMNAVLRKVPGNASSLHTHGRRARQVIDEARKVVAGQLGCPPEHVIFTSGGTEANNAAIKGTFAAAGRGHIVTTKIEHESVLEACRQVEARGGRVTYVAAGADGRVRVEDVRAALAPDTLLVSVMHANNETGAIQPVEEIGRVCREAGVPFHTDAVQTFAKIPTRVDELGCEFLSLSAHKINGPKGVGALYWRGERGWVPLVAGGTQERQLRGGTEGVHQIAGLGAACRLAVARMEDEKRRLAELRGRLLAGLAEKYPGVRINEAPPESQMPGSVNATFPGKNGLHILAGLDCYEVSVSIGSACTADRIEPSHVLLGMGLSEGDALATVRISMGTTTGAADVNWLLSVLGKVLEKEPEGFSYMDPQHLNEEVLRSERTFVVDLRFPYERMLSPSIPGAKLWSHIGFERYIKKIPRDRDVIMMCSTGIFSLGAAYRLARSGHPSARVVYGGYAAWRPLHPGLIAKLREQ